MRSFKRAAHKHDLPDSIDALLEQAYRYAFSLAHDAVEAEDLLQDTCLAILAAGGSWQQGYVFATIRNRFIDRYRRNRKILFLSLDHEEEMSEADPASLNWDAPDVLQNEHLGRALGSLKAEEGEALFLSVVEGYTAEEIAELTARPRGTILSLLHRTKAKLRDLLGKQQARR